MKKQLKQMMAAVLSAAMVLGAIAAPVSMEKKVLAAEEAKNDIVHAAVHDPSILYGEDGTYYIFGSNQGVAKSADLMEWKTVTKQLYKEDTATELAESFVWAGYQDGSTNAGSGMALWAPSAIYNPYYKNSDGSVGSYMLYYPASSNFKRGCIGFAVSGKPAAEYDYVDTIVYSGFTKKGGKDEAQCNDTVDTNYEKTNLAELMKNNTLSFHDDWLTAEGDFNIGSYPQAIDPTIFFDKDGELWMCYGSHGSGIWLLPLDRETGQPKFLTKEQVEAAVQNGQKADQYFGYNITSAGEGPFMFYDSDSGYYYLTVSYGQIVDGYNMRLFRSKTVNGIYEDAAGNNAAYGSEITQDDAGVKMIGNYQFESTVSYCMAGHNSMINRDGELFNIYHQRFATNSSFSDRVHQMFRNEKGWLCTAVYEYAGDKLSSTGYDKNELIGSYQFVNHGSVSSGSKLTTYTIQLKEDGTVTGDMEGTWSAKDGTSYMSLVINGVTYDGVFFKQQDESEKVHKVMTFTAVGENNEAVWGSKMEKDAQPEKPEADKKNPAYAYDFTVTDNYLTMNSGSLTGAGILSGNAAVVEDEQMGLSLQTKDEESFLKISGDSLYGMTDGFSIGLWAKREGKGTLFSAVSEAGSITLTADWAEDQSLLVEAKNATQGYMAGGIKEFTQEWNYIGLTVTKDTLSISLNGEEFASQSVDLSALLTEENLAKQTITFGGGQSAIDNIAIYAAALTVEDYASNYDTDNSWTTDWYIDFGPEGSPQWDNYTMMYSTTVYKDSAIIQNYGFTEEIDAYETNAGGNKIRDFVYKAGGKPYTFKMDLPNGEYSVFVYSGNKMAENTLNFYFNDDTDKVHTQVTPEGVGSDNYGGENTYKVNVTDGVLSITFWGDETLGEDAITGALNSLEIKKVKTSSSSNKVTLKKTKITGVKRVGKTNKYKVTWKKVSKAKGYVIQISDKKSFKKIAYKATVQKNSCVVKKKVLGGAKYIRVRSYTKKNGKKVYSKWSAVKKVVTK